ncbi:MAG: hypothetical protein WB588_08690 [Dehalococcoidia bacterium]
MRHQVLRLTLVLAIFCLFEMLTVWQNQIAVADNTSLLFLQNWGHVGSGQSCTNSCGPCVWFQSLKG